MSDTKRGKKETDMAENSQFFPPSNTKMGGFEMELMIHTHLKNREQYIY